MLLSALGGAWISSRLPVAEAIGGAHLSLTPNGSLPVRLPCEQCPATRGACQGSAILVHSRVLGRMAEHGRHGGEIAVRRLHDAALERGAAQFGQAGPPSSIARPRSPRPFGPPSGPSRAAVGVPHNTMRQLKQFATRCGSPVTSFAFVSQMSRRPGVSSKRDVSRLSSARSVAGRWHAAFLIAADAPLGHCTGTLEPAPVSASCQGRFPKTEAFVLSLAERSAFRTRWLLITCRKATMVAAATKNRRTNMTDNTTTAERGKLPSHCAYQVRERTGNKKSIWTRIGSAWPHADGQGFSLQLDSVPLDGRVSLRVLSDNRD